MPTLFLTEADVRRVLTMRMAIDTLEDAFRRLAEGDATQLPRRRVRTPQAMLHTMSAGSAAYGALGAKLYTTTRHGAQFHIFLYDGSSGEMTAVIEADWLGQVRTGAASGLATQCMARPDATVVGVFGSGKQARTQLEAMCAVRPISEARVYSSREQHRARFAREMSERCGIRVVPVHRPEQAAMDMDILVTATNSAVPVLLGRWLSAGAHINAIGSNALTRAELDADAVARADTIVIDSIEQGQFEAGDLVAALEQGRLHWSQVHELAELVVGKQTGRPTPESITLFKSLGVAIEDLSVAARVLERAREAGLGRALPW